LFVPVDAFEIIAQVLLVEAGLAAAGFIKIRGQKRDESGVSTSSIRINWPSKIPNSNLVSAMMMPRSRA